MARSPEVDERLLSYADRRSKHRIKFLLTLAGIASVILIVTVISGGEDLSSVSFADMSWTRKISIGMLAAIFVGANILGQIYVRKYVNRGKPT